VLILSCHKRNNVTSDAIHVMTTVAVKPEVHAPFEDDTYVDACCSLLLAAHQMCISCCVDIARVVCHMKDLRTLLHPARAQ